MQYPFVNENKSSAEVSLIKSPNNIANTKIQLNNYFGINTRQVIKSMNTGGVTAKYREAGGYSMNATKNEMLDQTDVLDIDDNQDD